MSDIAIRVQNISKDFRIGSLDTTRTFREAVVGAAGAPARWLRKGAPVRLRRRPQIHQALKDVSFEVKRGEVLGIIGRNGAGKSTLLKILSRITEPTSGRIDIYGRVGSLLEVGTGFHPELSGRENIYMNGAILGMSKREIRAKFDEIVAFSGVEKFLDTPFKRYSSGMRVRLGFAVAAHLEPEILIVDEVLAVGDAEFQRKCIGKMNDVAQSGRTVLFVSHDLPAVESLCCRGVLLDRGRIEASGSIPEIVDIYVGEHGPTGAEVCLRRHVGRRPTRFPVMTRLVARDRSGRPSSTVAVGSEMTFELHLDPPAAISHAVVAFRICGRRGERVMTLHSRIQSPQRLDVAKPTVVACGIQNVRLVPGLYHVEVVFGQQGQILDEVTDALTFEVMAADIFGTGKLSLAKSDVVVPEVSWSWREEIRPASAVCEAIAL